MHEQTVRLNALVFHKNATVVEAETGLDEFWVALGPSLGFLHFTRQHLNQERFLLRQVQSESLPIPSPLVSVRGVLWSRRAALEANQAISSYLAGIDQIEESSPQLATSRCRHES